MKNLTTIGCGLILSFTLVFCGANVADQSGLSPFKDGAKRDKKGNKNKGEAPSTAIEVMQQWQLPGILQEVSGIAYLGDNRFACIQDEAGVIFIYHTGTGKIERQVAFGASGDYEGLALVDKTAYVVRSDGKLFEVDHVDSASPRIKSYVTPLTAANNVEGITYDARHNRLLLAIKGAETGRKAYKGIYAFDLKTKKLLPAPVLKLNLQDPLLAPVRGKDLQKALQPSEIAVNPATGTIFLTEAANPQLLELKADGTIKARYKLSAQTFSQPEGIAFGPGGTLYLANEGRSGGGNILQVRIR